jgi:hypothetical protein
MLLLKQRDSTRIGGSGGTRTHNKGLSGPGFGGL